MLRKVLEIFHFCKDLQIALFRKNRKFLLSISYCISFAALSSRWILVNSWRAISANISISISFKAFWKVVSKSLKSIGFVTKTYAPRFITVLMFFISPYAETITVFINKLILFSSEINVNPSIFGILISLKTNIYITILSQFFKCIKTVHRKYELIFICFDFFFEPAEELISLITVHHQLVLVHLLIRIETDQNFEWKSSLQLQKQARFLNFNIIFEVDR